MRIEDIGQIKVAKRPIDGFYIIEPAVHGDSRGDFMETYNQNDMREGFETCGKWYGVELSRKNQKWALWR